MNKFQFMYKTIRHAKTKIKPFTYFNRILKNTMCLYNFSDLLIYSLTNYYVFYYVKGSSSAIHFIPSKQYSLSTLF